jgi:hypothetical protein
MGVRQAIRDANACLLGEPATVGQDPRWHAIIAVAEYVETEPELIWEFIRHWGGHPQEDLRNAIATCLLEHLLEHHFVTFFARVEQAAWTHTLFGDMFLRCWRLGQAEEPGNAELFNSLRARLLGRVPAEQGPST